MEPKFAFCSKIGSKFIVTFCSKIGPTILNILSMADEVTISMSGFFITPLGQKKEANASRSLSFFLDVLKFFSLRFSKKFQYFQ